jgi:hypothetical protein
MHLESVRALKQELFAAPAALVKKVAAASAAVARAAAARGAGARRGLRGIALGAIKVEKDYCLAVRQQETGPLIAAMTDEIRRKAKGEVDVRYVGKLVAFGSQTKPAFYRATRRPLRIGASISDVQAQFRKPPHWLGMLTNNHVIAGENGNAKGSPVVQQGTLDKGKLPAHHVGELWKVIRLRVAGANAIDAAVGAIYEDVPYDEATIGTLGKLEGIADAAALPARAAVHKVGRTTGQTKGRITAFDVDNVVVEYDIGDLRFDNQIEIEGAGSKAFSDSGDSGSLIVDGRRRAVGLLFAGGDEGGSNGKGLTYANPIRTVLDALRVDLIF